MNNEILLCYRYFWGEGALRKRIKGPAKAELFLRVMDPFKKAYSVGDDVPDI